MVILNIMDEEHLQVNCIQQIVLKFNKQKKKNFN